MKETKSNAPQDIFLIFRDLLLYVLLRWRSILAAALVLAVLAGGFKYWQDYRHYQSRVSATQDDAAPEELDASSMAKVTAVQKYRSAYESACTYNQSSLLMRIDPDAVPTENLSYLITGNRAYAIATLYQKYLADEDMYTAITGQTADRNNDLPQYLAELVTATLNYEDVALTVTGPENYLLLDIRVVAPTRELCTQIAQAVKDRMPATTTAIKAAMGSFSCQLVYDQEADLRIAAIRDQQQTSLNNQNTLETKLAEAEEALSSAEKDYLQQQEDVAVDDETPSAVAIAKPSVSKKMLVLGFLAGGVLMAFWHVLRYIFSRKVQSQADLLVRYPIPVFGAVAATGKKGFFLDRWFKAWLRQKPDAPALVQRQVAVAAQHAGSRTVCIAGDALTGGEALYAALEEELKAQDIVLCVGGDPLQDQAALDTLTGADALLLVEKVDASSHRHIARLLELAENSGCTVLGAVLLQ